MGRARGAWVWLVRRGWRVAARARAARALGRCSAWRAPRLMVHSRLDMFIYHKLSTNSCTHHLAVNE